MKLPKFKSNSIDFNFLIFSLGFALTIGGFILAFKLSQYIK